MKVRVPAWSVLSVVAGAAIVQREYDNIAWAALQLLIPSCMLGIAFGLFFYNALNSASLARGLGILVVLYGILSLRASMRTQPDQQAPPKSIARQIGRASCRERV